MTVLRAIGEGLREYERYAYRYIQANLITALLLLPIVTGPAAYAGLIHMVHTARTQQYMAMVDFWEGFRRGFWRSLTLGALNAAILFVLYINYRTYSAQSSPLFAALRAGWAIIAIFWFTLQLYVWPLLEVMDPPAVLPALRNATLMMFRHPGFSMGLSAAVAVWLIFSFALVAPLVLFTFGMLANVSVAAVADRLALDRTASP